MPYGVVKSGSGYKVHNKHTGKTYSKKPLSKSKAKAQMAAIAMNSHESNESDDKNPLITKINEALKKAGLL